MQKQPLNYPQTTITPSSKKAFTQQMLEDGFVLMSSEKFTTTRLYNKKSGTYPANDYIPLAYARYCKLESVPKEDNISAYVKASLPLVTGTLFRPNSEEIINNYGSSWINTYKAYEPKPSSADISLFLEYLTRLFPDSYDYSTCVSWLAHMFQRPEQRPSWHLLLTSHVGTGKGFLVQEILNPLLVQQTSVVSSFERVMGKFSTVLSDNMLVLLDDPKSKSDNTATQLKSLLSEERAYVEQKGLTGGMVDTFTRFILASNEARPLRLDDNERRWYCPKRLEHRTSKEETQLFIGLLADALKRPGYLDAIYNWFMAYDIGNFNHKHIAQSDMLLEMIGLSENSSDYLFSDFTANHSFFKQKELLTAFEDEGLSRPHDAYVKNMLQSLGFKRKQFRSEGIVMTGIWCKADATQADYEQYKNPQKVAVTFKPCLPPVVGWEPEQLPF